MKVFFGKVALISVGGIDNAQEAYERIKLGASLVQVYSGLVFQGPSLCKNINEGLLQCLRADGFTHLYEALGQDIKAKPKTRKKSNADKTQDKQDSKIVIKTKPTQTRKKKLDSSKDTESTQKAPSPKKTESKKTESKLDSTQKLADKDLPTSQIEPSQAQQDSKANSPKE